MTDKTLTTEAKIKRIQQLMRQHLPTSKLYQSMAPQLQTLLAQLKAERQEAAKLKALEVECRKAEADEKKRQAALAAQKAQAEAVAAAQAAAEKEAARQAALAAEKAQALAVTQADSLPALAAHTKSEPTARPPRRLYHARGCFKATYTDGKLLWHGHQLACSGPPWLPQVADIPLYFKVYPSPRKLDDGYSLSKFRIYRWSKHEPKGYEDGEFLLGGCWIYASPDEAREHRPIFRVYRNRRRYYHDQTRPLNLKLQWPEQTPLTLIPSQQPGWKGQYNFYEIKATYDPVQQSFVFKALLSGPSKMPFALNYHQTRKKKQREVAPTGIVEAPTTAGNLEDTPLSLGASSEDAGE